mgnify:CR=1 FL=1
MGLTPRAERPTVTVEPMRVLTCQWASMPKRADFPGPRPEEYAERQMRAFGGMLSFRVRAGLRLRPPRRCRPRFCRQHTAPAPASR